MLNDEDLQKIRVEVGAAFEQIVLPQFDRIDKRFEQVDKRFEQVDKRFEQVDKRFEQVDKRLEQVDKRLERIESDLRDIRLEMASIHRDLEALSKRDKEDSGAFAHEILAMKRRLDALEHRVNQKETAAVAA